MFRSSDDQPTLVQPGATWSDSYLFIWQSISTERMDRAKRAPQGAQQNQHWHIYEAVAVASQCFA
jgi:hypothetical protein